MSGNDKTVLTQSYLKEILDYDEGRGLFIWRWRPKYTNTWNAKNAGKIAGNLANGYWQICIDGKSYYAHRLAWLHVNGKFVKNIDHINGVKTDNRISNLRPCNKQQNALNSKISSANTSGSKGVRWHKASKKWAASIRINGKSKHLGLFDKIEDASIAYLMAADQVDGRFTNRNYEVKNANAKG